MKKRHTRAGLIGRACAAVLLMAGMHAGAASAPFVRDCRELTRDPHRLTGTEAAMRAAAYVERELRAAGADQVLIHDFPVPQLITESCFAEIVDPVSGATNRVSLWPMRPNGIVPPATPPEGIAGPVIHAGDGRLTEYGGRRPEGCVAVLDYNSGDNWLQAFRLGARAVVFVRGDGPCGAQHAHYTEAHANLPRFFHDGPRSDLPEGAVATLHGELAWKRATGRNIYAFFRGSAPRFQMGGDELLVLGAGLDSFGEAPERTPGARGAATCAALLKLARALGPDRPRRNVLLVFYGGENRGHAGSSAFAMLLDRKPDRWLESHEREQRFIGQMLAGLDSPAPLTQAGPARAELIRRLQSNASEHVAAINDRAAVLRRALAQARQGGRDAGAQPPALAPMQAEKDAWNALRRALSRAARAGAAARPLSAETADRLATAIGETRADVLGRAGELEAEGRAMDAGRALQALIGDNLMVLHLALSLGDTTARWGLLIGGNSAIHSAKDDPGLYARVQGACLAAARDLDRGGQPMAGFETRSADGTLAPYDALWAAPSLTHSGEVLGRRGVYNLVLGTVQEALPREGTPDDTLAALGLDRIESQAEEITRFARALADRDELSQPSSIPRQNEYFNPEFNADLRPAGPAVIGRTRGSSVPNKPMPGAIVQIRGAGRAFAGRAYAGYQPRKPVACEDWITVVTDHNGSYAFGPVWPSPHRIFAGVFDARGQIVYATARATEISDSRRSLAGPVKPGFAALTPQVNPGDTEVLDGAVNSPLNADTCHFQTTDGVVAWYSEEKTRAIKLFGLDSVVALGNGPAGLDPAAPPVAPEGVGFPAGARSQTRDVTRQAASDLWRINESRLAILRERGIRNRSIEALHGLAETWLRAAPTAEVAESQALAASAFLSEKRVYKLVRATLDDLLRAVLILLALCVPFAFVAERLLIGSTGIYRRIAWCVAIFLLAFLILYATHPAFAIAKTPMIIFLGFAVLVLSCLVIVIVMQKFEVELKVLQGLQSTVHAADVSRFGTILAAMSMGISTMRRRPMRTALTAVTIILLTFTILCFASFGVQMGIVRMFVRPLPEYAGIQIRQVNWSAIPGEMFEVIQGRWSRDAAVCRRLWLAPVSKQTRAVTISRDDGSAPMPLRGALGLDPEELRHRKDLRDLLGVAGAAPDDETVWITRAVADRLGVQAGQTILVNGRRLKAGPLLDASKLSLLRDLDDSEILPVDFAEMQGAPQASKSDGSDAAAMKKQNWTVLPLDAVAIVWASTAEGMGAALHAVHLYPVDPQRGAAIADDLARILDMPVSDTRPDGVYRHVLAATVRASGVKDLVFPILLGGLVIFGTMLGSVADRQKEIYTFSALGLAPQHVAGLFAAEALVYSVLGGLCGYMLAQAATKILTWLAAFGTLRVPEMNYSSTNAVVTILIVMGTVLCSAIYPAVAASRSANPGILRAWRLPPPDGDTLRIVFPFTVSVYDITGVVSFLKEHFDNHGDTGMGVFMSRGARLVSAGPGVGLKAWIAPAPFDLGVTQSFALSSAPSGIAGIDEVKITLTRQSGQPKDWLRLNKVLLDDLRKQFLIWRSLPPETMDVYRAKTVSEMESRHDMEDRT